MQNVYLALSWYSMIYEEKELRFKLWQMLEPRNRILQKCTIKYDEVTSSELRENQVNTFVCMTMKMLIMKTSFLHTKWPTDLDFMTPKGLKITSSNGKEVEEYKKEEEKKEAT